MAKNRFFLNKKILILFVCFLFVSGCKNFKSPSVPIDEYISSDIRNINSNTASSYCKDNRREDFYDWYKFG
ncbi:MAG: hypothetical protein OIF36_05425 [Alphaproteobacteria bacterium]|nr:hypothetical protein [Alphaproteobacteria bacterium]